MLVVQDLKFHSVINFIRADKGQTHVVVPSLVNFLQLRRNNAL